MVTRGLVKVSGVLFGVWVFVNVREGWTGRVRGLWWLDERRRSLNGQDL